MSQGFSACNDHGIAFSELHDAFQLHFDLRQRLMAFGIMALITVFAGQIAVPGRFQPTEPVVGHGPGHPIKLGSIDDVI